MTVKDLGKERCKITIEVGYFGDNVYLSPSFKLFQGTCLVIDNTHIHNMSVHEILTSFDIIYVAYIKNFVVDQ